MRQQQKIEREKNENSCTCIVNTRRMIMRKYVDSTTYEWVYWWKAFFPSLLLRVSTCYVSSVVKSQQQQKSWKRKTYNEELLQWCSHSTWISILFAPFSILCGSSKRTGERWKNPMKGEMWAEFSIRVGEFLMLIFCASFRCLCCAIKINASEWTNSENAISILGASSAV